LSLPRYLGVAALGVAMAVTPVGAVTATAAPIPLKATDGGTQAWYEVAGPYRSLTLCKLDGKDRANGRPWKCVKGSDGKYYLLLWYPPCLEPMGVDIVDGRPVLTF
jgi:hypothetical protein